MVETWSNRATIQIKCLGKDWTWKIFFVLSFSLRQYLFYIYLLLKTRTNILIWSYWVISSELCLLSWHKTQKNCIDDRWNWWKGKTHLELWFCLNTGFSLLTCFEYQNLEFSRISCYGVSKFAPFLSLYPHLRFSVS